MKQSNKRAGDNQTAAAIILADPEKYGGEQSLAMQWARKWTELQSKIEAAWNAESDFRRLDITK